MYIGEVLNCESILVGESVLGWLEEQAVEADASLFGISVFTIPDEECEWIPGMGKWMLGSQQHVAMMLGWVRLLRKMPDSTREQMILEAKEVYAKRQEEKE